MLKLAYWNLHKNPATAPYLESIALDLQLQKENVFFCLAEVSGVDIENVAKNLTLNSGKNWKCERSKNKLMAYLSNCPGIEPGEENGRAWPITLNRIINKTFTRVHVWIVHLRSPSHSFEPGNVQSNEIMDLIKSVSTFELDSSSMDTIIIGDFNMSPFAPPMINPKGLNAVMCRKIASQKSRKLNGEDYPFFYNPTWHLLGDQTNSSHPGTFYKDNDPGDSTYWHMIDQIVVRPGLMSYINPKGFRVLTATKTGPLLTNGKIDLTISDHLPIIAEMSI